MKPHSGQSQDSRLPLRHPLAAADARRRWEDQRLSDLLARLPDTPMPVDFTEQVLRALDQPPARRPALSWRDRLGLWMEHPIWNPRLAAAAAILLLVPGFWIGHNAYSRRHLATSVAAITRPVQEVALATQLPPVEVLQDFEFIDQMRRLSALADEELLASLEPVGP